MPVKISNARLWPLSSLAFFAQSMMLLTDPLASRTLTELLLFVISSKVLLRLVVLCIRRLTISFLFGGVCWGEFVSLLD